MKNFQKFTTAQERAKAFRKWYAAECHAEDDYVSENDCFTWLDLEAEEEKPETIDDVVADMEKAIEMMRKKESEGAMLFNVSVIFDKFLNRIIAAHNRVAKKCGEGK